MSDSTLKKTGTKKSCSGDYKLRRSSGRKRRNHLTSPLSRQARFMAGAQAIAEQVERGETCFNLVVISSSFDVRSYAEDEYDPPTCRFLKD